MTLRSDEETWAVTEFAEAELGDARRTQRVIALATAPAQRPGASLHRKRERLPPVAVWAVQALEETPPPRRRPWSGCC